MSSNEDEVEESKSELWKLEAQTGWLEAKV